MPKMQSIIDRANGKRGGFTRCSCSVIASRPKLHLHTFSGTWPVKINSNHRRTVFLSHAKSNGGRPVQQARNARFNAEESSRAGDNGFVSGYATMVSMRTLPRASKTCLQQIATL